MNPRAFPLKAFCLNVRRLETSVKQHFKALAPHRKSREKILRAYAGSLYPGRAHRKEIINLLRQAVEAQTITLAANNPRCLVTTHDARLRGFAEHMGRAVDRYSARMHLQETLEDFARNAFFGLGIAKVCMSDSSAVVMEADEWMDPGYPACLNVSQDHFVWDSSATEMRGIAFAADRYRVRFQDVVDDVRFDSKVRKALKEKGPECFRSQSEGAASISSTDESTEDHEDYLWLADVFLPKDGKIYTFPVDGAFGFTYQTPISEVMWDGSESGPYHYLNLGPVPDNCYPSAPGLALKLLHELVNSNYKKLEDQAKLQKEINLVVSSNVDDGEKIRKEPNGGYVVVTNANAVIPSRFGGPDQNLFSFTLNAIDQFKVGAGNLENQLGQGAQADTLGQEQMIGAAVGTIKGFFQARFGSAVEKIMREIARLLWQDQLTSIPGSHTIPGTRITVDDSWLGALEEDSRPTKIVKDSDGNEQEVPADFDDFDVMIDPYSMRYQSPEQRSGRIRATFQEIVAGAPIFATQGVQPDAMAYLTKLSRYENMPEYLELVTANNPPVDMGQGGGAGHQAQKEYVHRSVSSGGGNPGQQQAQMMSAPGDAA